MRLTDRETIRALYRNTAPMTQAELAARLGCHERTVHRSIARLRAAGAVDILCGGNRSGPYQYQVNLEVLPDDIRSELKRSRI